MIAFMGIVLASCENGTSQGKNPYPYLRLSDIAPLHLIPLSKAEAKFAEMGFKDGEVQQEKYYMYYTKDRVECIICIIDADGLITGIVYDSKKDVIPTDAKEWLAHIPEKVNLPTYSKSIPFYHGHCIVGYSSKDVASYDDYLTNTKELTIGMYIDGEWKANDCDYQVGIAYSAGSETMAQLWIMPQGTYLYNIDI